MSYIVKTFQIDERHTMAVSLLELENTIGLVTKTKLRR